MSDHRFEVAVTIPAEGVPDGDYTQDFIDAGTTFTPEVPGMVFDPIPVESAEVEGGMLTVRGRCAWRRADR